MKILAMYHESDLVMTKVFGRVASLPGTEVISYFTGDGYRGPEVRSKFQPGVIRAIRRIIRSEGVDIIYATSTSELSNALFATLGTRVRVVGYRGTQHRIHRSDPTNYMALLNPRVSHIVCATADIREALARLVPERKLSWRHKPFLTEWVAEAVASPATCGPAESRFRCIYIGNTLCRPYKGLTYLIEAMKMLEKDGITLAVVGTASEEDMAAAPSNVVFLGPQPAALRYIPFHRLLVLPSTRDASPRTVREAMACGVPCVVTDIPGARELITDGVSGLLVPPADPAALAGAIRSLASDPARREAMGRAAVAEIEANFSLDAYVDYLTGIFRSLM